MKKFIAVLLSVLVIFSAVSVLTFAEDAEEPTYYTIKFVDYDGTVLAEVQTEKNGIVVAPENPSRESTEEVEYIFKGWQAEGEAIYAPKTIPLATADATYTAAYSEQKIEDTLTFWEFIASLFQRLNVIFEYFARLFERVSPAN